MKRLFDRLKRMLIVGLRQIQDPYYHGFAAQISFYLMLSVVPLFLLLVQILGLFDINTETAIAVIEQYTGNRMSGIINTLFEFNYLGMGNIVFLIIALWAGSRASFTISRIANYTMTEGESTGKNYFIERARAITTMGLTLLTLVAALIILCYGKVIINAVLDLLFIEDKSLVDSFWMWLRWPLGFVLYFFIIGCNYYILPTKKRPFRTVMPGAIFASGGMLAVSWGYSFYAETLAHYDIMYGALSSVVAIMIWFLLLSWVIILGVMINKVFEDTSIPFSKKNPPRHLEISKRGQKDITVRQSKFDIDPDEVSMETFKEIFTSGAERNEEDDDK